MALNGHTPISRLSEHEEQCQKEEVVSTKIFHGNAKSVKENKTGKLKELDDSIVRLQDKIAEWKNRKHEMECEYHDKISQLEKKMRNMYPPDELHDLIEVICLEDVIL